ncbi:hypothetical protein GQR58_007653 [Nymphon striatum]|nr:hypothetical protein GQR58_007653 [Nymphon striatum]
MDFTVRTEATSKLIAEAKSDKINNYEHLRSAYIDNGARAFQVRPKKKKAVFPEMNSEYAKIILEKREKDESIDKISAMTSDWNNLIMEKRYSALVSWSTVTMIFNEDLKSSSVCHFSVSKGFIFQGDLMLAFPKNSNLISHFNKRIPWLRKFGIHDYWWNKVFYKTKKCSQNRKPIDMQQNRKLKFEDIIGLLCFWATGILLSICVFVLEISVHRYRIFKNNQ